jgi:SagB-type dehydrogenase family enzyme
VAETASLGLPVVPYSSQEVDYPAMRQMQAASSLTKEEVKGWSKKVSRHSPALSGKLIDLKPLSEEAIPKDTIEQVIQRRGSARHFAQEPISFAELSTLLDRATRGIPADFLEPAGSRLNEMYLIVNNVESLAPGAYYLRRDKLQLELLKEGDFRKQAGYLGLEQQLPADASVNIFFLADLNRILDVFGNRGYRATQLEAGIIGGKLYIAAYAQRLGATGLTFYDDDVVNFFSPHAKQKSAIFLVACGQPLKA